MSIFFLFFFLFFTSFRFPLVRIDGAGGVGGEGEVKIREKNSRVLRAPAAARCVYYNNYYYSLTAYVISKPTRFACVMSRHSPLRTRRAVTQRRGFFLSFFFFFSHYFYRVIVIALGVYRGRVHAGNAKVGTINYRLKIN